MGPRLLELSLNRPAAAWAALEPAVATYRAGHIHQLGAIPVRPDAVEAALALGRIDDARALVEELERAAHGPWQAAFAPHRRGLLRAADGDLEGAQATLEHAIAQHPRLGSPFALGRTLLALGAIQRRAKRKRAARESLDAAMACFSDTGATLWVQRAHAKRARIGASARSPAWSPTASPNRQVAASLFVSIKTVDANLQRIYRKLNVRSRTQLARKLTLLAPDDTQAGQGEPITSQNNRATHDR